ncbi:MAG: hypothetical protein V3R29_10310 [Candidatus Acidoferrales bacterium]
MAEKKSLAKLEPLFFGRVSRVVAGGLTLYWAAGLWGPDPGAVIASLLVGFLGLSFLVGGLMGNPGCELTALPNLFFPPEKRYHTL